MYSNEHWNTNRLYKSRRNNIIGIIRWCECRLVLRFFTDKPEIQTHLFSTCGTLQCTVNTTSSSHTHIHLAAITRPADAYQQHNQINKQVIECLNGQSHSHQASDARYLPTLHHFFFSVRTYALCDNTHSRFGLFGLYIAYACIDHANTRKIHQRRHCSSSSSSSSHSEIKFLLFVKFMVISAFNSSSGSLPWCLAMTSHVSLFVNKYAAYNQFNTQGRVSRSTFFISFFFLVRMRKMKWKTWTGLFHRNLFTIHSFINLMFSLNFCVGMKCNQTVPRFYGILFILYPIEIDYNI